MSIQDGGAVVATKKNAQLRDNGVVSRVIIDADPLLYRRTGWEYGMVNEICAKTTNTSLSKSVKIRRGQRKLLFIAYFLSQSTSHGVKLLGI